MKKSTLFGAYFIDFFILYHSFGSAELFIYVFNLLSSCFNSLNNSIIFSSIVTKTFSGFTILNDIYLGNKYLPLFHLNIKNLFD